MAALALQLYCCLCAFASEIMSPDVLPGAAEVLRVLRFISLTLGCLHPHL